MKKIILITFLLVLSAQTLAKNKGFTCALNRSFYIDIVPTEDSPNFQNSYAIFHRHFSNETNQHLTTLNEPEVVNLGDVLMIFQNFGKSGYVFIRIEGISTSEDGYFEGHLDINLFSVVDNHIPQGQLFKTFCLERKI